MPHGEACAGVGPRAYPGCAAQGGTCGGGATQPGYEAMCRYNAMNMFYTDYCQYNRELDSQVFNRPDINVYTYTCRTCDSPQCEVKHAMYPIGLSLVYVASS